MSMFEGIPPQAFAFFTGLEANNSKEYWHANKASWENGVRTPMLALLEALPDEFQPFRTFRMNRDVRFSKDKSPYKTMFGAASERDGVTNYLHITRTGLLVVDGDYTMARDQLQRYRAAVAHEKSGAELETIVDELRAVDIHVGPGLEEPLKKMPRGYPEDHPRIKLLCWKGLVASREFGKPAWLHSPQAIEHIATFWRTTAPLHAWLAEHVGPSRDEG